MSRECAGEAQKSNRFNDVTFSQAGRRGFEPRLPLHLFNHLEAFDFHSLLRLLRFLFHHTARPTSSDGLTLPRIAGFRLRNHHGFQFRDCLDLLLKIADCVHLQTDTQAVAPLIGGYLVVDVRLP